MTFSVKLKDKRKFCIFNHRFLFYQYVKNYFQFAHHKMLEMMPGFGL